MSDLLLMSPPGLPRNGLVALWDPYRDVYGRNVVSTGDPWYTATRLTVTNNQPDSAGGSTGQLWMETATEGDHSRYAVAGQTCVAGSKYVFSVDVKPAGRTQVRLYNWYVDATKGWTTYSLEGAGSVVGSYAGNTGHAGAIVALGNGWYRLTHTFTADTTADYRFWLTGYSSGISYAGDAEKGFYVSMWQKYFDKPYPYSAPAGAPGTLQTSLDYSGNGNHLTLGADTNASTDDPAFTGTALLHAADFVLSGNLSGVTMAGDWTLPIICKPSGTANTLVSLASASAADQYQAIEYNGSTKVRIKTVNGATVTTSDDLTVSATAVQMLVLTSSGDTLTLKRMDTGTSVTATNADPTGTARLCIGALGVNTVASAADALEWHMLLLYRRAWTAQEAARAYLYSKSLMARRGVTLA